MPIKKTSSVTKLAPDLRELLTILTHIRPHGSRGERNFVTRYVAPLGTTEDGFGNHWLQIGDSPIMFSCHTDTVHSSENRNKRQRVTIDSFGMISTPDGDCLGADDGAGIWLLRQMIENGVPGLYVFHRGEEQGMLGSKWAAKNNPHWVGGIRACIAFDRAGTRDVITHQSGDMTASLVFAESLIDTLGLPLSSCDGGVYTDSYAYEHLIPECTNVAVGYARAHSKNETLDSVYLMRLRDAVIRADFSEVLIDRVPGDTGLVSIAYAGGRGDEMFDHDTAEYFNQPEISRLYDACLESPELVATYLYDMGITADDIRDLGRLRR